LWAWCTEVVADVFGKGEELIGHYRADRVATLICITGVAKAIAEKAGDGVSAADYQIGSPHVDAFFF
jgi:hypothetical protein